MRCGEGADSRLGDDSRRPETALSPERQHMYTVLSEVDELQRRGETDFESALRDINAITVASVPGAQYLGVTVVDTSGTIQTLAATHRYPAVLDDVQRDVRQGPCLSAAWEQHTIRVDDLTTDGRWPRYRTAALERTPVRSIMSFRLFGNDKALAALNFYAESIQAFDDESVELGLVFAAHTTVVWNLIRRQQQFRSALANRDLIGQAKGILMERFDINAVAAFELLRRLSQESNTKIVEIAEKLIELKRR